MKQTSLYRYFRSVGRSVSSKEPYFDYTTLYEYGDIDGNFGYESQFFDCTLDQYNAAIRAKFHTTPMEIEKKLIQTLITKYFPKVRRIARVGVKRRLLMNLINIVNE